VQTVLERWTHHQGRFDEAGAASMETYIWKMAQNLVRDLERRELTEKRGGGRAPLSLDRPLSDTSDTTLGDITPDPSPTEVFGQAMDHELLRQAIARFRTGLAPRDRAILDAFEEDPSPHAVARMVGLPASTVYDWRKRIAQKAENAGLRDFLT